MLRSGLEPFVDTITSFKEMFRNANETDLSSITVGDGLVQSWICLVMGCIYLTPNPRKGSDLLEDAASLASEGLGEIVMAMSDRTLLGQAAVLPLELVSLMSLQLMRDATPGLPNITETYSSCILTIVRSRFHNPNPPPPPLSLALLCSCDVEYVIQQLEKDLD